MFWNPIDFYWIRKVLKSKFKYRYSPIINYVYWFDIIIQIDSCSFWWMKMVFLVDFLVNFQICFVRSSCHKEHQISRNFRIALHQIWKIKLPTNSPDSQIKNENSFPQAFNKNLFSLCVTNLCIKSSQPTVVF